MSFSACATLIKRHQFAASLIGLVVSCAIIIPACTGGGDATELEDPLDTAISFSAAPTQVTAGQSATFQAALKNSETNAVVNGATFSYSIPFADQSFATIDANTGVLTANAVQSAAQRTITVTASAVLPPALATRYKTPAAVTAPITIQSRVTGITLTSGVAATPTALTIRVGDPVAQLVATSAIATGSPSTPAVQYTYTSSNPGQVAVDAQGRVTAVAPTAAGAPVTITASAEGATSSPVSVTVLPALVPVVVVTVPTGTTLPLRTGDQVTLTANVSNPGPGTGTIAWTSSNPSLVSVVGSTGRITAHGPTPAGSPVRITATFTNGAVVASGFTDISVVAPPPTITVTPTASTLTVGQSVQITSSITNAVPGGNTTWAPSAAANNPYVSVSATGLVTAKAPTPAGAPVDVIATYTAGTVTTSAAASITVLAPPTTLDVPDNVSVQVGTQTVLTATIANPVTGMTLAWVVRPSGVATLGELAGQSATIQATAVGTTYAVATLTAGSLTLLDSTRITVTPAPQTNSQIGRIVLEPTNAEITAPATLQYRVRFFNTAGVATTVENGGVLQFVSCSVALTAAGTCPSTQNAASISSTTGLATGVGAGTTTITARYLLNGTLVTSDQTPLIVYPAGSSGHVGSLEISTAGNARTVSVAGQPLLFQVIVRDASGAQITTGTEPTVFPTPDAANPYLKITRVAGNGFFYQITGLAPTAAGTATNPLANAVVISADMVGAHAQIRVVVTP